MLKPIPDLFINIRSMKAENKTEYYSVVKIAEQLGTTASAIYQNISKLQLKKEITLNRKGYYSLESLLYIKNYRDSHSKKIEIEIRYYPLKTTEQFYIYESKMNKI